ncbi:MAG: hypothetical protein O3B41_10845 [Bacteroidetes bacterium]|nr:hypothetical protein [Bacteroidota bacterium]
MRYGLIAVLVVVFGLGEYAFVEYYPLHPYQRLAKFQELPIVKQFVIHQEADLVRKAIEGSEEGSISTGYGDDTVTWTSVEEWRQARKNGDQAAKWAVRHLRDVEKAKENLPALILQAEAGDPSAAYQVVWTAKMLDDAQLKEEALSRLKDHPTTIGKYFYHRFTAAPDSSKNGIDSAIWFMRVAIENWRSPFITDEQFKLQTDHHANSIAVLRKNAETGNVEAIWMVDQLKAEGLLN